MPAKEFEQIAAIGFIFVCESPFLQIRRNQ